MSSMDDKLIEVIYNFVNQDPWAWRDESFVEKIHAGESDPSIGKAAWAWFYSQWDQTMHHHGGEITADRWNLGQGIFHELLSRQPSMVFTTNLGAKLRELLEGK